jgi:hypothetical protein
VLYVFGFDRVGVVVSDLYFVDPNPAKGQEGPEQGVRLEVRLLTQGAPPGSIYASRPIGIDAPVWRADLLESVDNPGSFDRTHHHPHCANWEPGQRKFVKAMTADPVGYVGARLADLDGLLADAGLRAHDVGPTDAADLRHAAPEICDVVSRLLDRVRAGELGQPPVDAAGAASVRASWL